MITRALDSAGDWTYGSGQQNYLLGESAIEQNIVTTVQSWIGDIYYALDFGVDWYNRLDVGQQNNLVQEIRQVISSSYGVVGVLSINGNFNGGTRFESISVEIATIFTPQAALLIPTQGT